MTNTFSDSTDSSHREASWSEIRDSIFACGECLRELSTVKVIKKRLDTFVDPNKPTKVRLLFVSEAPPGGKNLGDFFHNPDSKDSLRRKLFLALSETRSFANIRGMPAIEGLRRFFEGGLYLLPSFNYPCSRRRDLKKNGKPSWQLLAHSAKHLAQEIVFIRPPTIFALGRSALFTLLNAFGGSTQEAANIKQEYFQTLRIGRFMGRKFPIEIGSRCDVWIEKWPRIESLANRDFRQLVRDLQFVLDGKMT